MLRVSTPSLQLRIFGMVPDLLPEKAMPLGNTGNAFPFFDDIFRHGGGSLILLFQDPEVEDSGVGGFCVFRP